MSRSFRRVAAAAGALVILLGVVPSYAQTQGMERRNDRRNNRAAGRAAKQACKAGDEKTNPECRQLKRSTKQAGREAMHGGGAPAPAPAAPGQPAQ
jgi:hypothetical protein